VLKQAIYLAGPNTFRHAATLGGLVASGEPDSELLALLIAMDAALSFADRDDISVAGFLRQPVRGLITHIRIPSLSGEGNVQRVARTPADKPIVAVVAWNGRVAASGIAPHPVLLEDDTTVTHPGDFRGSQEYRAAMLDVLRRRAMSPDS
jgi:CO/xanthine dehydrogenase FAD-binding subunit